MAFPIAIGMNPDVRVEACTGYQSAASLLRLSKYLNGSKESPMTTSCTLDGMNSVAPIREDTLKLNALKPGSKVKSYLQPADQLHLLESLTFAARGIQFYELILLSQNERTT